MASLAASAASEGLVLGFGGLLPVRSTVAATTTASETSQPKMNPAPFRTPPWDARIRMNAVSGIGSSVIAKPIRTRLRTSMRPPPVGLPDDPPRRPGQDHPPRVIDLAKLAAGTATARACDEARAVRCCRC